ncbi:MAG: ABC transporter permease [Syntrophobacterales bacterium]|jgi:ABC-2 type transport system permease protein|nr:ABC transporter permease [Syntrophobacterales bacterium]
MSLSRVCAVFVRQLFLLKSNPTRLVGIFLWLVIDIIQWGFISRYLGTFGTAIFNFITVILGAILLWGFMSRIQQGIFMAFLEDIWAQNFINFFASPLKIREYLSGLVLTSITNGIAGFLAIAAIAGVAFGYNIFKLGALLLPFMIILLIFGIAMGIFVSAIIFRLGPSAEWIGWPIPIVLSLFAGVYYPVSTLPYALRVFARLVPASYVFESIRSILTSGGFPESLVSDLLVGSTLSIGYLLLSSLFFIRIYRKNLQNGNISRFNAEAL